MSMYVYIELVYVYDAMNLFLHVFVFRRYILVTEKIILKCVKIFNFIKFQKEF